MAWKAGLRISHRLYIYSLAVGEGGDAEAEKVRACSDATVSFRFENLKTEWAFGTNRSASQGNGK